MATVKWTLKADRLFDQYVFNAFCEFGRKTSQKWMQERIKFTDRVAKHPESYDGIIVERQKASVSKLSNNE